MGDGVNVSGEYGGSGKDPRDYLQGGRPGSDPIWEKNVGGYGPNDECPGRFSP